MLTPRDSEQSLASKSSASMDTILTALRAGRKGSESGKVAAVAVHEDVATEGRVHEFCLNLGRRLGSKCEVVKQLWLLTELRLPQLRAVAAGEAAAADLVIVSVHHAPALPPEVRDWIELWLGHKTRRSAALLALFDPLYRGDSSSLKTYLAEVARRGKVQFVAQSEERLDDR